VSIQREGLIDDIRGLQRLAGNKLWDPLQGPVDTARLDDARWVNECLAALTPGDHEPPLRLSRIHQSWATLAKHDELREHHQQLRQHWLQEALHRDPPEDRRHAIANALSHFPPFNPQTLRKASAARATLMVATLPDALIELARSLRRDDPRLPHLACLAARRAMFYADRYVGPDPRSLWERCRARTSLAASYRKVRRSNDAVALAREALGLVPDDIASWTVLMAATREAHDAIAATRVLSDALGAVGVAAARSDPYFAAAAGRVCYAADEFAEAAAWYAIVLTAHREKRAPREDVLRRCHHLVSALRSRGLGDEAEELERLLEEVAASARRGGS